MSVGLSVPTRVRPLLGVNSTSVSGVGRVSKRGRRMRRRTKLAILSALAVGCVSFGGGASTAQAFNFCGGGNLGGNGYCNFGYYIPIPYIEGLANAGSYAVYRATSGYAGAPSASGTEYYTSGYVYQSFHCYGGYPASHNRHSYAVYVYYTNSANNCV